MAYWRERVRWAWEREVWLPVAGMRKMILRFKRFIPCARTNPLVHCLSIATDCKQRFGNVVERLHFLISNGPVGDVVTFLFELIRLPVDLEMRGEAKIDRQGAKGPRTPNDRAASKHRSGPRSTERRSCLLIRCPPRRVISARSAFQLRTLKSETVFVVRLRIVFEGIVVERLRPIRALLKHDDFESRFGEQPTNCASAAAASDNDEIRIFHKESPVRCAVSRREVIRRAGWRVGEQEGQVLARAALQRVLTLIYPQPPEYPPVRRRCRRVALRPTQ